ncbi:MAG: DNA/RNA nuclease SfsA [Rhodospirillaceae bacterium]|nr:DNA/RNA nuclease SfsA [Rhodospirillaceae bacterium]RPF94762.1 MAG: DNA/RNA nuclease SfsA [Rhodospirillaceae bacterium TMED63]RZO38172.1 MAG: DNA/RNA nuclease SfsA [Rhodospirillaceae bacterium]
MDFPDPLLRGTLVKRYKRFMADVMLESGDTVTAHCANTGAMLGVQNPGSEVWLSPARNPDRKLKFTWEMIRIGESLVGINTAHPNKIVAEAIEAGKIPELSGYGDLRREVKYGTNSRIDILLSEDGKPDCYVEIKNVHLMRDTGVAEFPDSVSTRAAKHQGELANMVEQGARSVTVYLCQREDCDSFRLAADIDPDYARAVKDAKQRGVEAICYACALTPEAISVSHRLEMKH